MNIRARGPWEYLNALDSGWHRLKTSLCYRPFFKKAGSNLVIRRPILIANPRFISLGSHVYIRDGARLEAIKRPRAPDPAVQIGNHVTIEQNFHLACCSKITIDDYVSIAPRCAVVDITHPFWKVDMDERIAGAILEGEHQVVIGRRAVLGLGVTVLPNVTIGEGAVIGAHSVVTSDVPPYCVAAGSPARVLRSWK